MNFRYIIMLFNIVIAFCLSACADEQLAARLVIQQASRLRLQKIISKSEYLIQNDQQPIVLFHHGQEAGLWGAIVQTDQAAPVATIAEGWVGLPNEIIMQVAGFLNPLFLTRMSQLSKKFRDLVASMRVYQLLKKHKSDLSAILFDAVNNDYLGIINYLVRHGLDINVANPEGHRALARAAYFDHQAILDQLIQVRADVNVPDVNGVTATILASYQGHTVIVKHLVQAKADVNLARADGLTALMMAAEKDFEQVVRVLLESRADINLINNDGQTALAMAMQSDAINVIPILQNWKVVGE